VGGPLGAPGGDTDVLPARYGFSLFGEPTERDIPSDAYFACLDGNWNRDGDGVFGEAAAGTDPGDSTDFYAEVYVGRASMSNPADIATFVTKIQNYENPTQLTYQNKALFLGEVLFPVNWVQGMPVSTDGGSFCDEISAMLPACDTIKKLYEDAADHPGSLQLSKAAALTELNTGYGFVNHIGHGFRYSMSCADASLQNYDAMSLTNGDKRFVLFMLNCTATAFDFPCLGEAFLRSPVAPSVSWARAARRTSSRRTTTTSASCRRAS
jgi:hypothetical protein